ncbi:hypothetical protein E2P81_ATG00684 [Venturia nashicola]|uniref:Secreted protein n=1 Tax=Venturia nashicola TaxID=86259 RepID=A0A4Z1PJ08_9PEZI|nr:hypothetical protein E6O75_ATG00694 [Venturia nashicola]TLD39697.1 hypothetical protein E2P81_ATG00684 [Venturia nashicola]
MKIETLLPAILFAQSSFAYCCVEVVGPLDYYSRNFDYGAGGVVKWQLYKHETTCTALVTKTSPDCTKWTVKLENSKLCGEITPLKHAGPTASTNCANYGPPKPDP